MVFKGLGCGASGVGFYGFQGFRVWGFGCRVKGSRLEFKGFGFLVVLQRVQGL